MQGALFVFFVQAGHPKGVINNGLGIIFLKPPPMGKKKNVSLRCKIIENLLDGTA